MAKKSLKEKVQKQYPTFVEEVDGLSVTQLEKRLSDYAKAIAESVEKQAEDAKLQELQDQVSLLKGDYTAPRKELAAKSGYMVALIKEKGGQ